VLRQFTSYYKCLFWLAAEEKSHQAYYGCNSMASGVRLPWSVAHWRSLSCLELSQKARTDEASCTSVSRVPQSIVFWD
jgi:hypothetical protein